MERCNGFNFRLFVPSRVNKGQMSAVQPLENKANGADAMNKWQQDYSKCSDKEKSMPLPSTSKVAPTKPTRQDLPKMKVVPPMDEEENNSNPGQLFSKLIDEVEKIKCWKVQVNSDAVQKERRLEENKRTIESQRKAILDLQLGNESLSNKLEEQFSENEDLRNKNNTTRNLCCILKDTCQQAAEKMCLFERERDETQNLFKENTESVQKLTAAFESLCMRAEADQQEMQKVKQGLLQYESLKEKYQQDYKMKENEVEVLQTKLKQKESELQKVLLDFQETQEHCKQLQEATNEQYELLKSSKTKEESLLRELHTAEQHCKESEKNCEAIAALLEQNKTEYAEMIRSKDVKLEELSRVENHQAEKLEQIQTTIQELQISLALEIQRARELEVRLERDDRLLGESMEQNTKKDAQIRILQDELDNMKAKIGVTEVRVKDLAAGLSGKTEETQLLKTKVLELEEHLLTERKKNKEHFSQIAQHEVKYKELLSNFNELQSEKTAFQVESGFSNMKTIEASMKVSEEKAVMLTKEIQRLEEENQRLREEVNSINNKIQEDYLKAENLQKMIEENCEYLQEIITGKEKEIKAVETKLCKLRKEVELKLKAQEDYQKEAKKLRLSEAEAIKNKEDTELKCQRKIADMVALMDKHKSQYDLMVEEKDAELDENKEKAMEAIVQRKSLELDLEKRETYIDELKRCLQTEVAEKENLQKELSDMKKEMSSLKITQSSQAMNKQSPASNWELGRCSETPKESSSKRHLFDFSMSRKTPSHGEVMKKTESESKSTRKSCTTTPKTKEIHNEDLKYPRIQNRVDKASKIRSYRIRTPPSDLTARWEENAVILDPKSDSSDRHDIFSFQSACSLSAPQCKRNILQKIQSPVSHKSPANSLKLAAIKRMRDAGWTAVAGCDNERKKKKRSNEKIFA